MIRVGIEDLNEKIRISIEDNGIGIPREFYPKIFQPNFTTKGSGTGLGLAFVKNVVVQAGGAVDFNSTEEIGTQFIIEFPILRDR
jgi:signal transduction histidine kinase